MQGEEINPNEPNIHSHSHGEDKIDNERLLQAFKDEEGCQLNGFILINKVPGNFHISSHAFSNILGPILNKAGMTALDLSHKINHLSFGKSDDISRIKKNFKEGIFHPLDGLSKMKSIDLKDSGVMHQYYISVVPTTFETLQGDKMYVHQFTANSNEI
jgi:hypothetical protein